jgi:hypothetical protein
VIRRCAIHAGGVGLNKNRSRDWDEITLDAATKHARSNSINTRT